MPIVIRPSELSPLPGPFEVRITVRGEDTAGAMASLEETRVPGAFVAPHTHENDVWVYVLSGEIGVLVGDQIDVASEGQWALKPRNVLHAMWNTAAEPARIVEVLTPAGSERWFEELASLAPDDGEGFDDACRRHGIAFDRSSPWIKEIRDRFGL